MIIIPWGDSTNHAAGGDWAINSTNFPALKHAWTVNGISGTTSNVDLISSVSLNDATGITNNGDGTFSFAGGAKTATGTFLTPGTKDILIIAVGTMSAAGTGFDFGNTTAGPAFSLYGNASAFHTFDTDQYFSFAASGVTLSSGAMGIFYDNSVPTATRHMYSAATLTTTNGSNSTPNVAASADYPVIASTFAVQSNGATSRWSGVYIFAFSGSIVTSAIASYAIAWMAANPGKVYPGFKGLAG